MLEADWLACTDPQDMLAFLQANASARKLRLLACACCRRIWNLLGEDGRHAVEVSERYADGLAGADDLQAASARAQAAAVSGGPTPNIPALAARAALAAAQGDARKATRWVRRAARAAARELLRGQRRQAAQLIRRADRYAQCGLLRDLFGNPFRAADLTPACRHPNVVAEAEFIYRTDQFHKLPGLGYLLERTGCPEGAILTHCYGRVEHARGCWVVDLILGKS